MTDYQLSQRETHTRLSALYALWFARTKDRWHRDWSRYYAKLAEGDADALATITFEGQDAALQDGTLTALESEIQLDDDFLPVATQYGPVCFAATEPLREQ